VLQEKLSHVSEKNLQVRSSSVTVLALSGRIFILCMLEGSNDIESGAACLQVKMYHRGRSIARIVKSLAVLMSEELK